MTVFVQYLKDGSWTSKLPTPTVTTGQTIGGKLALHNDHPDKTTKHFVVKSKVLNPSGVVVASREEAQDVGYGRVGFFSLTCSNTSKAGNYTAEFDIYIGNTWYAAWQGNQNVSPTKLIATIKAPVSPPDEEPPPTPPTDGGDGELTYFKVGEASFKSAEDVAFYQSWNEPFKAGDYGVAKLKFPIPLPSDLPNWLGILVKPFSLISQKHSFELSKAGIVDYYNSYLPSKGVQLWRSCYWDKDTLCVPFVSGIAPLVIIAIAVGVAMLVGTTLTIVALWKVGESYVQAKKDEEIEGQEQILKTISEIDDPELQAKVLLEYLGMKTAGESNKSIWEKLFGTPILVIAIAISAAIVALLVIRQIRR